MWADLKYAIRQWRRSPEFAFPAILTLALGIAVTAAVFIVLNRVVLQPLPYPQSEQLVRLWDRNDTVGLPQFAVSPGNYFSWQQQNQTLTAIGAYREEAFTLATDRTAEQVDGAFVTASLLQTLGVQPVVGRAMLPGDYEPGAEPVALVSYALASRLGASTSVVGLRVTIDGRPHTIAGVLPESFRFPQQEQVEILIPFTTMAAPGAYVMNPNAPERGAHFLRVLARLRPGVDVERARTDLAVIAGRLEAEYPKSNRGWTVAVDTLHRAMVGSLEQPLMILLGAAALLAIITVANVAGLLLARIMSRETEFTVRAAVGAVTRRIVQQLVIESFLLSFVGAAIGLVLGRTALRVLLAVNPDVLPRATEIAIDARAIAVILGLSVLMGLVFSLVPLLTRTLMARGRRLTMGTRGVRGTQPFRRVLVASQIALALALASGAVLLARNLARLQQIDPGFTTSNVLTMEMRPPLGRYGNPPTRARMYQDLLTRLEALPGVTSAGAAHRLPLGGNSGYRLQIEGRAVPPEEAPNLNWRAVMGRYFDALGMRIERGRSFSELEMWQNGGAVVINRAAAARYFADGDPLLRRIVGPRNEPLQVIGVIQDAREDRLDEPSEPALYFPYATSPVPQMTFVVRSTGEPEALALPAQRTVRAIDPLLAPGPIETMEEFVGEVIAAPRFNTLLLGGFAVIALFLTSVGVYGLTAYSVAQRTSEIGLRMALGANQTDIFRAILAPGLRLAVLGVIGGLGCAMLLARGLGGVILGVKADQPLVYAATALLLLMVTAVAVTLPARRAMRLDPVVALRHD